VRTRASHADTFHPAMSVAEYRDDTALRVAAINPAQEDIAAERVRR
jgi:hypothetical protein